MSAERKISAFQGNTSIALESSVAVPAGDGKKIYCVLNRAGQNAAKKVLIIAHGLTGWPQEYQNKTAQRYFNARGYDVIRIAFYSKEDDARKLRDCTLKIHAHDLNCVIQHISGQYEKTFVAGHSYGGLTVLFANPAVTAVSFWDSSFVPSFWKYDATYIPELDCYAIGWGSEILIGKAIVEEALAIQESDSIRMAQSLSCPAQVILAGEAFEAVNRMSLFQALKEPKDFHEISGADHIFCRGNVVDELLDKTYHWFEGHGS